MNKRDIFFGFGAGLLVAASILGITTQKEAPGTHQSLTKEQLETAAEELQLVVLSKEEFNQLQQEKKIEIQPLPTPPKKPSAPVSSTPDQPQAGKPEKPEAALPQAPVRAKEPKSETSVMPTAETADPSKPQQPVPADSSQVSVPTEPLPKETKTIQIPYKATAESVERTLVDAGILEPDNQFVETLKKQNKLNRIRVGTYQIPLGASEADIVSIIATPPKK